MTNAIIALQLAAFAVIGLLPVLFFRRGSLNPLWWVTALPFFVAPAVAFAIGLGWLTPLAAPGDVHGYALALASTLPAFASIVLVASAIRVHAAPPALWHQADDEPAQLVCRGPYRRIRHPFYAAFLLAFCGAAMAAPHPLTLACLGYAGLALNFTAAREERRLLASRHGLEYRKYMAIAGRFLPWPLGAAS